MGDPNRFLPLLTIPDSDLCELPLALIAELGPKARRRYAELRPPVTIDISRAPTLCQLYEGGLPGPSPFAADLGSTLPTSVPEISARSPASGRSRPSPPFRVWKKQQAEKRARAVAARALKDHQ